MNETFHSMIANMMAVDLDCVDVWMCMGVHCFFGLPFLLSDHFREWQNVTLETFITLKSINTKGVSSTFAMLVRLSKQFKCVSLYVQLYACVC